MRNLVIERISGYLQLYTDLILELDISSDELQNLSNVELIDLLEEIYEILLDTPLDEI